jgi:putative transposase
MGWFILAQLFSTLISMVRLGCMPDSEKDLEILILRHQLNILERKQKRLVRPNRAEKLILAVLTARLKKATKRPAGQLRAVIRIFQPETVLRWHRELVRRKWTFRRKAQGGRPRISRELEALIVRLARENSHWGYGKIEGELLKLGFMVSASTVRNVLNRHGILPAPVRHGSIGWRHLMRHDKQQLLACDFFTVETLWLQTLYVLFFIELGTRRVYLAGVTVHPDGWWVAQQARQMVWTLEEDGADIRFLIHDNDSKFTANFDTVFQSEGLHVIHTPFQAPNANSVAERWVRSVREECLDHLLILNQAHLRLVLNTFIDYYNTARPHQGLGQQSPIPRRRAHDSGPVQRREVLNGIIGDYDRAPGNTVPAVG